MAVLTASQLATLRQSFYRNASGTHNYSKGKLNLMFQAFEDERVARESTVFTDVDTATTPKVFTSPRKKRAFETYMEWRGKDGI